MITVQQIFDMAIHILDEQSEDNGKTVTEDTQEYKFRTISILNTAIPLVSPFSEHKPEPGQMLDWGNYKDPNMFQVIPLDDALSMAVLPYFLAAKLIQTENEELSALLMNQFNSTFQDLRERTPAKWERIPVSHGFI